MRLSFVALASLAWGLGCGGSGGGDLGDAGRDAQACIDRDGDGYRDQACGGTDCDDGNSAIHPSAEDVCGDGIDQDCSGSDSACVCPDADGDGYADWRCGGEDCDDGEQAIHPGAGEICDDSADNDCDGQTDCGAQCGPCAPENPCADLVVAAHQTILPGDDLQQANDDAPAGTVFLLAAGVHPRARVDDPKDGTVWVGEVGAVLDGQDVTSHAFGGSATQVTLCNLTLQGYADNGVHFSGGSGVVLRWLTVLDTGSGSGEENGAVRFENMSDLTVVDCVFEQVSSGVLPTACSGPIVIERNRGLNIGRNFVQLASVTGGGIRVRYNSMERDGTYVRPGNDDVEDWISVWDVHGLPSDYVQISFNRARGHGPSNSGSFIMLGDGGGEYQEAVGNIGVTPGQVGIGLSGGHFISVRDNAMFSASWSASNIAFYSADYGSGGCSHHELVSNRANWLNASGQQNDFWASGECDVTESGNVFPDPSLDESIWDAWPY